MISNPQNPPNQGSSRLVTLAVLTYQRDRSLRRAVDSMAEFAVPGDQAGWTLHELLVVDNNPDGSARPLVTELNTAHGHVPIRYTHEPTPGIVAARNRALDDAAGDVLVFIDDDEVALPGWPDGLLRTMNRTGAAMVGGPVVTEFVEEPPQWVLDGGFFDLPDKADGSEPSWLSTCNVAIDLAKIRDRGLRFDSRYPHGEDATLSRTAASLGLELRWSATAAVKEFVEPERTTVAWRCNRHRISTDAWVRADLDLDPSLRTQVTIVAKAGYRFIQGAATAVLGTVRSEQATRYRGLALMAQARGGIDGLRTFIGERRGLSRL